MGQTQQNIVYVGPGGFAQDQRGQLTLAAYKPNQSVVFTITDPVNKQTTLFNLDRLTSTRELYQTILSFFAPGSLLKINRCIRPLLDNDSQSLEEQQEQAVLEVIQRMLDNVLQKLRVDFTLDEQTTTLHRDKIDTLTYFKETNEFTASKRVESPNPLPLSLREKCRDQAYCRNQFIQALRQLNSFSSPKLFDFGASHYQLSDKAIHSLTRGTWFMEKLSPDMPQELDEHAELRHFIVCIHRRAERYAQRILHKVDPEQNLPLQDLQAAEKLIIRNILNSPLSYKLLTLTKEERQQLNDFTNQLTKHLLSATDELTGIAYCLRIMFYPFVASNSRKPSNYLRLAQLQDLDLQHCFTSNTASAPAPDISPAA